MFSLFRMSMTGFWEAGVLNGPKLDILFFASLVRDCSRRVRLKPSARSAAISRKTVCAVSCGIVPSAPESKIPMINATAIGVTSMFLLMTGKILDQISIMNSSSCVGELTL